jgi:hypothetical protein
MRSSFHASTGDSGAGTAQAGMGVCNSDAETPIFPLYSRLSDRYIHKGIPCVVVAISLFAARRPMTVIGFVIMLSIALMVIGLVTNFYVAVDQFEVFSPTGVAPAEHRVWLNDRAGFPKTPITFAAIVHANGGNVLGEEGIRRIFHVLDVIRTTEGYTDVCSGGSHVDQTTGLKECAISSATRFWNHNETLFNLSVSNDLDVIAALSPSEYPDGVPVDTDAIVGKPKRLDGILTEAVSYTVAVFFPIVNGTTKLESDALIQVLRLRDEWIETGSVMQLEVLSNVSYEDEFSRGIVADLPLIPLVFLVMAAFTCLVFYRRHKVESRVLLGLGSVFTISMSLMSAYGLLFIIGVPFTNMTQLVPFVAFGVGLDDTFIIVASFLRTDRKKGIEERIFDAMHESGLSITLTTVTTILAFGLGSFSSIPAVHGVCLYALATIAIDFIYQITFFIALLVLDERRIVQNRSALCVCYTYPRFDDVQQQIDREAREQPGFVDLFMVWYSRQLMRPLVKLCVIVGFTGMQALFIYRTSNLTQEFKISDFVPDGSYTTSFLDAFSHYSSRSLPVYAYFRFVDQSDDHVHEQMIQYMDDLAALHQFGDNSSFCWIRDFKQFLADDRGAFLRNRTFTEQVDAMLKIPFVNEVYGNNIVRTDAGKILASRCVVYIASLDLNNVHEQIDLLHDQRKVTKVQPINKNRAERDWVFFTFDNLYLTWEFYSKIVGAWIFNTVSGVAAVSVIGLLFLPHWTALAFLIPFIAMLYIDLIGTSGP